MFYFAYGSNMDKDQIRERIGDFNFIGASILRGYKLKFNKQGANGSGKANIVIDNQFQVEGAVFDINDKQLELLDHHERGYGRVQVVLDLLGGAVTYMADENKINNDLLPTRDYLEKILKGARECGLSESYQRKLGTSPISP